MWEEEVEIFIDLYGDGGSHVRVAPSFCFYKPAEKLGSVTIDGAGTFVRFGKIGRDTGIYLHEETGQIYSWFDSDEKQFINSSIDAFNGIIGELSRRYPFYSEDTDVEDWEAAARMVRSIVTEIDPLAADEESFWSYFSSDVGGGDFFE